MGKLDNPTRTAQIEKAWLREINKRWSEFQRVAIVELKRMNRQAQLTNVMALDNSQIRVYIAFLETQINDILLSAQIGASDNWQAKYQLQSYQRGLARSRAILKSQGATLAPSFSELQAAQTIPGFALTPSLGTAAGLPPIHSDALEFLFERSFDSLKGVTDKMQVELRQELFNGVQQGQGITKVTKNIVERIGVSESRAQLIARTETIQAHQIASTNAAKQAAIELDEPVLMRWIAAIDNRVRHQHAVWHGTLVTPEKNAARIQVSPWNCRCAQIPVIEELNTPEENAVFAKERKAIMKAKATPPPIAPRKRTTPYKNVKPKANPTGFKKTLLKGADNETIAFMDKAITDPAYKKIVNRAGVTSAIPRNKSGAHFIPNRGIHMAGYSANNQAGKAVYRHEYAHYIDHALGDITNTKQYQDALTIAKAKLTDTDKLFYMNNRANTPFAKKRYSATRTKIIFKHVRHPELEALRDSKKTPIEYGKTNTKAGGIARLLVNKLAKTTAKTDRLEVIVSSLITAEKHNYNLGYVYALSEGVGSVYLSKIWREAGQVADLVGSMSKNKWGGGHKNSYKYFDAETFAQVFSLSQKDAGKLGPMFVDEFASELKGVLDEYN